MAVIELNTQFYRDPHRVYDELRSDGPVHHVQMPDGATGWLVVDYKLAREVLVDPRVRKKASEFAKILKGQRPGSFVATDGELIAHMLNSDPPDHNRLRRLVNKAFTARAVERLQPRIEALADELLDRMAAGPTADLIADYAVPIPMTVICELLGVAEADRTRFREQCSDLVAPPLAAVASAEDAADLGFFVTGEERATAAGDLVRYLTALVAERTASPGEDLLSGLIEASHDGDKLSETELIAMVFLILVAGHETTVNLIANGAYALLLDPSLGAGLAAQPARIPSAVEEFLRWEGPVNIATQRFTAEPITLAGVDIPANELLWVSLAAANRDPHQFVDPHRTDLDAGAQGHLAFGYGIHYCVGAPLARLEGRIAFEKLLGRYPRIALAADPAALRWRPNSLFRGLQSLPVVLDREA